MIGNEKWKMTNEIEFMPAERHELAKDIASKYLDLEDLC